MGMVEEFNGNRSKRVWPSGSRVVTLVVLAWVVGVVMVAGIAIWGIR